MHDLPCLQTLTRGHLVLEGWSLDVDNAPSLEQRACAPSQQILLQRLGHDYHNCLPIPSYVHQQVCLHTKASLSE